MNRKNKTTLILKELITHFGFKSDAKFADFLGIAPQTLNSWRMRDAFDYDLVYSKCVGIDANWLLTGDGEMLKTSNIGNITTGDNSPIYRNIQRSSVVGSNVSGSNNQVSVGEGNTLIGGNAHESSSISGGGGKAPQGKPSPQPDERSLDVWELVRAQQQIISQQQQTISSMQQTIDFLTKRGATAEIAPVANAG